MTKILLVNIIIILAASVYMNEFILTDEYFHNAFKDQLSNDQIESMTEQIKNFAWIDYALAALAYLLQVFVFSAIIYLVIILNEIKAPFSDIAYIVAETFTIFLIPILIKAVFLSFSTDPITPDDLRYFSFGSLLNLFDAASMENWLKVILKSINIWEGVFMLALAVQLKQYFGNNLKKSMGNVVISYGGGLMTWVLFAAFLAVTFSQN